MSIRAALYSHLIHDATVTALVGTNASLSSPDIYREPVAPSSAGYPRITMQQTSNGHVRHMGGGSGITATGMQLNCAAQDPVEAEALFTAVRESLDTLNHATLGTAGNTIYVNGVSLDNDVDDYIPPANASQVGVHRIVSEWTMWHEESVP